MCAYAGPDFNWGLDGWWMVFSDSRAWRGNDAKNDLLGST